MINGSIVMTMVFPSHFARGVPCRDPCGRLRLRRLPAQERTGHEAAGAHGRLGALFVRLLRLLAECSGRCLQDWYATLAGLAGVDPTDKDNAVVELDERKA